MPKKLLFENYVFSQKIYRPKKQQLLTLVNNFFLYPTVEKKCFCNKKAPQQLNYNAICLQKVAALNVFFARTIYLLFKI